MRVWTIEQATLNGEIHKLLPVSPVPASATNEGCARAAQAFSSIGDRSNTLNLLNRYETSYDRQFSRAFRRLIAIREAKKDGVSIRTQQVPENKAPGQKTEPNSDPI